MSNLEKRVSTILFVIFVTTILAITLISATPLDAALNLSSPQNNHKSANIPSVEVRTGDIGDISHIGSGIGTSDRSHNQSTGTSAFSTSIFNQNQGNNLANSSSNKVVMINFDDGYKSQLIYAKPILDRYGFKASFFIVCGKVGTQPWLNWQDIAQLKKDGMDIESHTMTHAHLNTLAKKPDQLYYEIAGSKQCLSTHGYNATIFGYPNNLGSNVPSVVNMVAKYYNFGRSGTDPLMFLNCSGYTKDPQTSCVTYSTNGKTTHANRYDIRSASFYHVTSHHNLSPPQMFQVFLQIVDSQIPYNNGKINAIPIIVYHNLTNSLQDYTPTSHASSTTVDLFAQEMKYLHDNGFRVLLLNQLGYNQNNNVFYIKNFSSAATANAAASLVRASIYWGHTPSTG